MNHFIFPLITNDKHLPFFLHANGHYLKKNEEEQSS
jgi:hypothetical protein